MSYSLFKEIGNKTITLETGKLAEQANGAVTVRCGDTILLVTAGMSREPKPDLGFFPLTVDFEERMYASEKEIADLFSFYFYTIFTNRCAN